ncbi:MAG: lytic murein transglycosylase [Hyphomicrobiales bacterium]|nr:lytic murein transglycosylase [Hyphomicrobiales bacterium]
MIIPQPFATNKKRFVLHFMAALLLVIAVIFSGNIQANANAKFRKWIKDFYPVAAKRGIKKKTYDQVFFGIKKPIPQVLESARYQPEFTSKIWDYLDRRIRESIIRDGQKLKKEYRVWLDKIERKFGVDRHIVLAIWSMESSYGEALKEREKLHRVAGALATLAYGDKKRAKFARSQLIAAMRIVQNGDITSRGLKGSWAGAMGHTQFIPTSYQAWAVDIDGNGRRDVWNSPPDALASAANLLLKNGWKTGKTWGYEVKLPRRFRSARQINKSRTIAQWQKLGIKRANGKSFPRSKDKAVLKLPAGAKGPAFLMLKNFFVLKRYNNADKYALAVGHLADRIRGGDGFVQPWPRGYTPLNERQAMVLQKHLARLGFYDGEIDGNIGSGSRAAILAIQNRFGYKVDGYASNELLVKLQKK